MNHYLVCFLIVFSFSCRKNETKDDDKKLFSSDLSPQSETTRHGAYPLRLGEAFLTCDKANDSLATDDKSTELGLTCEVISDAPIDDWQFFTKDIRNEITEINVVQHNEGSTIWRLAIPDQIIDEGGRVEIMIWSKTAEDAGFSMRAHNMHAIASIPENRMTQSITASSGP